MGCVLGDSSKSSQTGNEAQVDEKINMIQKDNENRESKTYKLLLLGAGESGKSTLLRQMRRLHGADFTENELMAIKPYITQNLIESMRTLAIYSDIFSDKGRDTKVKKENDEIRTRVARMSDKQKFTKKHYEDLKALWNDPHIKNTLEFGHEFQIIDTAKYLFDRMDNYWRDEYIPTFEDLIHCRQRTVGVNKIKFELSDSNDPVNEIYEIYDAGGQRNERRKWMHFFDNTAAIIFVAALSGYNQTLWEDTSKNRMKEAIALFRGIVNLDHFKNAHIIIFLNKSDLFDEKVGKYSVKEHFTEYQGNDNDKNEIISFFKKLFRAQWNNNKSNKRTKPDFHFHVTCATDTSCIAKMFESCRTIIIKNELRSYGFL